MDKKRKNVRNWFILLIVILLGAGGAAIVGKDVDQLRLACIFQAH